MRKLEKELLPCQAFVTPKIKEYRGVPETVKIISQTLPLSFIYGNLIIDDDDRNEPFGSKYIGKSFSIRYWRDDADYGLAVWETVKVHPGTVGQRIYNTYYEGDILGHSDFPDCRFEFTYSKTGWTPKVIYGTLGNMYLRDFPSDIEEYEVLGYAPQYPWYPTDRPRWRDIRGGIFLMQREDEDIYYDSSFGNVGSIYGVIKEGSRGFRDLGTAESIEDPYISSILKERKLII